MLKAKRVVASLRGNVKAVALLVIIVVVTLGVSAFKMLHVQAAANDVIINEIMYNPISNVTNDEFLELYNTTASPIDLENWCFTQGIVLCFSAGTSIAANGYLVISPNSGQTNTTYGVTPAAIYTGSLSNGGEVVTLVDNTSTVVNSVTYDDVSPWPTAPDGNGHSLELKDSASDNTLAANWEASIGGGTPGAQNSVVNIVPPAISNVSDPNGVAANDPVNITATITDTTAVDLKYKINFDADVTLTMYDDGAHNDGAAADDVYGAQIPGQPIKTLVRFKIEATNASGTQTSPDTNDSMDYNGYEVKDPSVTSNNPIIDWFMSDVDYDDMVANHSADNQYFNTVVVYGDDVYDNSLVRVKGDASRIYEDKRSLKFKLPSGHTINLPGGSNRSLSEFHLNGDQGSSTQAETIVSWWVMQQIGIQTPDYDTVRVQRNGEFHGVFLFNEKYEKEYRQEYGLNGGDLFENFTDSAAGPNDTAARDAWKTALTSDRKDPAKLDYILDNMNLSNIFNYMSANTLMRCYDYSANFNIFEFRDTANTDRWSLLPWDLDLCWTSFANNNMTSISPFDTFTRYSIGDERFPMTSVYQQSSLRALYFRRLKTVIDKMYSDDTISTKYHQVVDKNAPDMVLDEAKWDNTNFSEADWDKSYSNQKNILRKYASQAWILPPAQTDLERQSVTIDTVNPDAIDGNEYIMLSSTANTPVDLSDWQIDGINYTIPAGTVIPANGSIYLLKNDKDYRATHSPVLVAGQYTNDLGSSGSLVLKTDNNIQIDSYDY